MGANASFPYGRPAAAPPRQKTPFVILLVVAVMALMGVLFVAGPFVMFMFAPRNVPRGMTEIDPEDVPKLILKHMPCKRSCAVTHVTLGAGSVTVSVPSEEIEGRSLSYRIDPAKGAQLTSSMDDLHPASYVTIDLDEVDWSVADKLVRKLEAKAVSGRKVRSVQLSQCKYDTDAEEPVRACFTANVLTKKGDLEIKLDAKTGKPR